ncbi:MAG: DUF3299 domain-containing protein [Hydrogenophilaceae bacterium]|nr:DUF3299 domain-containing protein [Hydrogenophilaceae bacterium]
MKRIIALCCSLLAASALAADYKVGDRLAPATAAKPATYKEVGWDDLLPKDWDPMKTIKDLQLDKLKDSDPRAMEAMDKLKAMWNAAPTNPAMAGKAIRIPGFMVPLEFGKKEVKEFLLVPYFGACIHVPPPPANQIIHVIADQPFKTKTGMDAVWVSGVIEQAFSRSDMGESGYRMRAVQIEPYKER